VAVLCHSLRTGAHEMCCLPGPPLPLTDPPCISTKRRAEEANPQTPICA
jgi:hypothetical protein